MSDRDALLAAILAAPDDDLPRLVFADHLDESGHPADAARAQFIRLQVEAERHPKRSPHRRALYDRAESLRSSFHDEWDRVFQLDDLPWTAVARRRGFVEEVRTGLITLRHSGNVMFAIAPIRSLQVSGVTDESGWADFGEMEFLGRLAALRVGPQFADFGAVLPDDRYLQSPLAHLLRCAHLGALRRLDISHNGLDDGWVLLFFRGLRAAGFSETLVHVDLSENRLTDASAHTLIATAHLDRIGRLVLTGNRFTPHGSGLLRQRFGERVIL